MGSPAESKSISLSTHRKFGEVLVDLNFLTQDQVDAALERSNEKRLRLGDLLLGEGLLSEEQVAQALAAQYELPFLNLDGTHLDSDLSKHLPERIARGFSILPVHFQEGMMTLTTHDPIQFLKLENLKNILTSEVALKVSPRSQIEAAINRIYNDEHSVDKIVKHLARKQVNKKASTGLSAVVVPFKDSAPSIESLVNKFISRAIMDRASDIHIDPAEEKVRVRGRIDGILHELYTYPPELHQSVASRIKVLSNLDISERRHPQDGGFHHSQGSRPVDIRVSTLPTAYGEKLVLRLLDKEKMRGTLAQIGMSSEIEADVQSLLQRPHGIILITGPTGSGKTTTLYSMLNQINAIEKNIITVEDPIEFKFDVINQVQVNEKAGLSFAGLLRNILRQDPDIVMIGEVRDQETADLAIRAALTGHLVLSTIHTNDAVSTPTRLMDMGIEPFLLASGLSAVLAQRLVRVLCVHCRKRVPLSEADARILGIRFLSAGTPVFEPVGCEKCLHSGYQNRIALFELMRIDDFVRRAFIERKSESDILQHLSNNGFISMRQDGGFKIVAGITSVEEVLKATL
ncbi:MAG: GspE/PulE family protein [Bdellovibrionales bacterium]|nr:GspE/PulE family protein [Bdellovibrionales bacterium]